MRRTISIAAISVALSMAAGSFIYQAVGDQNWQAAIEHTWFASVGVLALALCLIIRPPHVQ